MVFAESRSGKLHEKAVLKISFVKFQTTEGIYLKEMVKNDIFLENSEVGTKTFMSHV